MWWIIQFTRKLDGKCITLFRNEVGRPGIIWFWLVLIRVHSTGGSIKNPTRHQCIQDNGSQQPLGVRTSHFDIINNEMRSKTFSEKFKNSKNTTVKNSNLNNVTVKKLFFVPEHVTCIWCSRSITNRFRSST